MAEPAQFPVLLNFTMMSDRYRFHGSLDRQTAKSALNATGTSLLKPLLTRLIQRRGIFDVPHSSRWSPYRDVGLAVSIEIIEQLIAPENCAARQ